MSFGIPPLLGKIANIGNTITLLVADAKLLMALFDKSPKWGIYDQAGKLIARPDSFLSLDFKADWRIPDYPIENGAFAAYNKVATPFDVRVSVAKGGTQAERTAFIKGIQAAAGSTELLKVITPAGAYNSVNLVHFDYEQKSTNGVGLVTVDLWLQEVRVTASRVFSNTKAPSGAAPVSNGSVQAQSATAGQTAAAGKAK